MENKEVMRYKVVRLVWIDPQFLELGGLSYQEDLEGLELQKCSLVGHLVKETSDAYFIAKELWDNGAFKYVHMIPKKIVERCDFLQPEASAMPIGNPVKRKRRKKRVVKKPQKKRRIVRKLRKVTKRDSGAICEPKRAEDAPHIEKKAYHWFRFHKISKVHVDERPKALEEMSAEWKADKKRIIRDYESWKEKHKANAKRIWKVREGHEKTPLILKDEAKPDDIDAEAERLGREEDLEDDD